MNFDILIKSFYYELLFTMINIVNCKDKIVFLKRMPHVYRDVKIIIIDKDLNIVDVNED